MFDFSGILDGFGKVLSNPLVQQGVGAGVDYFLNKRAGDKTSADIRAMGSYNPYNVFSGFGNLTRDGNNLSFGGGASDALLAKGMGAINNYNPDPRAAAADRYQMLTDLALPQENRQFQRLKDNLFASGRAGTTGGLVTGDDSLRAFQESSNTADLQRQLAGQDFARQQNQDLYAQGTGFVNSAFAPFGNLANASIGAGAPNAAAGAYAGIANDQNASQYGAISNVARGVLDKGFEWITGAPVAPVTAPSLNGPYNPGTQPRPI